MSVTLFVNFPRGSAHQELPLTMPWIERVRLRNYRTFVDCMIPLRRKSVILGANNVGKTSLLEAIESVLGAGRRGYGLTEDDVRRGTPAGTKIFVDIVVRPDAGEQFSADEHAVFGTHVDLYEGDRERLLVQVEGGLDPSEGFFRTRARFLKSDGEDDGPLGLEHRRALSVVAFSARRDTRSELSDRAGLWARITGTANLSAAQMEELRRKGEEAGKEIIKDLLGSTLKTEELAAHVAALVGAVLYGGSADAVMSFSATPLDARQLLRQIEIRLQTPGDADPRPLLEHSTGTQAVLLLGLFSAYIEALGLPVLAVTVEEPEVHLFPHAARTLAKRLGALQAQTLLTTHSTSVTDLADPRNLVVLRRRGSASVACSVPEGHLTDDEAKDIARRMRSAGSAFVFARAILIAEGQSEELAFPILAEYLGFDFDSLGISLVTVDGNSFGAFAKLLHPDALSIPYLIVCDNDAAVSQLVKGLERAGVLPVGVDPTNPRAERAILDEAGYCWWSDGDFESCLIAGGAGPLFQQAIADLYGDRRLPTFEQQFRQREQRGPIDDRELLLSFLKGASKPRVAQRVAELIRDQNRPVPAEIQLLLERLATTARAQLEEAGGDPAP